MITSRPYRYLVDHMFIYDFMIDIYERDWRNGVPAPFWNMRFVPHGWISDICIVTGFGLIMKGLSPLFLQKMIIHKYFLVCVRAMNFLQMKCSMLKKICCAEMENRHLFCLRGRMLS